MESWLSAVVREKQRWRVNPESAWAAEGKEQGAGQTAPALSEKLREKQLELK